ncbi:hypothetical protein HPB47_018317 [Ixodes persulcatus]|uniref:Uncharacterized protein n=1 Tax=Ixodes persulcatus TaxID=34615 RepID=A0AC60QNB3_IXOPE|nr:hypothetical protein HPB47_018317 [Ixodes persulcatus]
MQTWMFGGVARLTLHVVDSSWSDLQLKRTRCTSEPASGDVRDQARIRKPGSAGRLGEVRRQKDDSGHLASAGSQPSPSAAPGRRRLRKLPAASAMSHIRQVPPSLSGCPPPSHVEGDGREKGGTSIFLNDGKKSPRSTPQTSLRPLQTRSMARSKGEIIVLGRHTATEGKQWSPKTGFDRVLIVSGLGCLRTLTGLPQVLGTSGFIKGQATYGEIVVCSRAQDCVRAYASAIVSCVQDVSHDLVMGETEAEEAATMSPKPVELPEWDETAGDADGTKVAKVAAKASPPTGTTEDNGKAEQLPVTGTPTPEA